MEYTIQNRDLTLVANDLGGLLWNIRKADGQELIWGADPAVWPFRAPVCFPWCGVIQDDWFEADGVRHTVTSKHGFVRDFPHQLVDQSPDSLTFRFTHDGAEPWPWSFTFQTVHKLEGKRARTICTATNTSDKPMPTQMGYHPGFRVPFVPGSELSDYVIRLAGGAELAVETSMFDDGPIVRKDAGDWCRLEHKPSGKYIQVATKGWFCTVLWAPPGVPGFLCMEPWDGHVNDAHDLMARPGAFWMEPGESRTWSLDMDFQL